MLARRHLDEQTSRVFGHGGSSDDPNRTASELAIERERERLRAAREAEERPVRQQRQEPVPESSEARERRLADQEHKLQGLTPAQRRELSEQN